MKMLHFNHETYMKGPQDYEHCVEEVEHIKKEEMKVPKIEHRPVRANRSRVGKQ